MRSRPSSLSRWSFLSETAQNGSYAPRCDSTILHSPGFPALRLLRCLIPDTRQAVSVDSVSLNLGGGDRRRPPHICSVSCSCGAR